MSGLCATCNGDGYLVADPYVGPTGCPTCNGTGYEAPRVANLPATDGDGPDWLPTIEHLARRYGTDPVTMAGMIKTTNPHTGEPVWVRADTDTDTDTDAADTDTDNDAADTDTDTDTDTNKCERCSRPLGPLHPPFDRVCGACGLETATEAYRVHAADTLDAVASDLRDMLADVRVPDFDARTATPLELTCTLSVVLEDDRAERQHLAAALDKAHAALVELRREREPDRSAELVELLRTLDPPDQLQALDLSLFIAHSLAAGAAVHVHTTPSVTTTANDAAAPGGSV